MPADLKALMHQVQCGNRMAYELRRRDGAPAAGATYPSSDVPMVQFRPHIMRAGIENVMVELGALAGLLIEKGVITEAELMAKFEEYYLREVIRLTVEVAELIDVDPSIITLV